MDGDSGSNSEVDFSLEPTVQGLFTLMRTGSYSVQLLINHDLDRETRDSYSFRVFATDRGTPALVGETQIDINVLVSEQLLLYFNNCSLIRIPRTCTIL